MKRVLLTLKNVVTSQNEIIQRFISFVILVVIITPCFIFGRLPLWIITTAVTLLGISEFCIALNRIKINPSKTICYIMTLILFATYFAMKLSWISAIYVDKTILAWIFISLIISLIYEWQQSSGTDKSRLADSSATMVALLYIPFSMYTIMLMDMSHHILTYLVIIVAFGTDCFAFLIGKCSRELEKLGIYKTHRLAFKLSPNKTIEGAIGGLIGCCTLGLIFSLIFAKEMWITYVVMSFIGGIAAECGDLVASAIKRQVGIKDYGSILPGMGGILDRFDSVLLVAPTIYFLAPILL